MAVAHLIHGYLGAGKTTFSKQLERELSALRYSPDEWLVTLFGHDPPAEHFAESSARVFSLIDRQWPRALELGVDVILDFGFWSRSARDAARAAARDVGAETRLYSLTCPEPIARARCLARNAEADGTLFISENTFELLKNRFEPLAADEAREEIAT